MLKASIICLLINLVGGFTANNPCLKFDKISNQPLNNGLVITLKNQKKKIDNFAADTNKLIVFVKVPNSNKLELIKGNNFPDEVEITYNILKDGSGKIIYAVEIPNSESGDWFIAYKSYFDADGKLFAFQRMASFFNSGCTKDGEAAFELSTNFYNNYKTVIDSTYKLTGANKKPLKKSNCTFNYNYPYKVVFNVKTFLGKNRISL